MLSARSQLESELRSGATDAIVKAEKFQIGYGGTYGQCGRQVNRVQGAHWFRRKGTSCPLNNLQTDSIRVPVRGCGIKVRPTIRGRSFVNLSESDRPD